MILTLLTSDIPSYDLLGVNIKILDKLLQSHILDKDSGSRYTDPVQSLTYMLDNQETDFTTVKRSLSGQRDAVTYMNKITYCQRIEFMGSMISSLTTIFSILLHCCQEIIHRLIMATKNRNVVCIQDS